MIISGGQTGADYGALLGAKSLGIQTGGYAPFGFRTERGPVPDLGRVFGLQEHSSEEYAPRTAENIKLADATVLISMTGAPERGTKLTEKLCTELRKPCLRISIPFSRFSYIAPVEWYCIWANEYLDCINFAGNRESIAPGIERWTQGFIRALFG